MLSGKAITPAETASTQCLCVQHVHEDIPGEVDKARVMHANITMTTLPHIGASPQMKDLIRGITMNSRHGYQEIHENLIGHTGDKQ